MRKLEWDFFSCFFSFSNTISVNFWFEPTNTSKNDEINQKKTNFTRTENEKESDQEYEKLQEGKEQPVTSKVTSQEDGSGIGSSAVTKQINEGSDDITANEAMGEGTEGKNTAGEILEETEDKQEKDEKEIELSTAQYLALLRETEVSLYKATLSHAMVSSAQNTKIKQIAESLNTDFNNFGNRASNYISVEADFYLGKSKTSGEDYTHHAVLRKKERFLLLLP